jgi:hypothetical protein
MKTICVLRVALVLACLTPLASLATFVHAREPVLTDTFDDPSLPGWEHSPAATVVQGALRIEPGGFAMHVAFWQDFMLTVRVRYTGEGDLLIRYRWTEDGNYAVRLSPDALAVQRQLLGPPTDLGTAPAAIPPGEWVEVGVTVRGRTHQVTPRGQPALSVTDPDPLPEGGIGFLVEGEAVGEFDGLEVHAAEQPPTPAEPTAVREPSPTPGPTGAPSEAHPPPTPEEASTPAGRGGICPWHCQAWSGSLVEDGEP